MTCEHLQALEQAILAAGIRETYRGQAWPENCREGVCFACCLDLQALRGRFALDACVEDHAHRGTHDGSERGFVCGLCHDAVMGRHDPAPGVPVFR